MSPRSAGTVVLLAGALMAAYVLLSVPTGKKYKALWGVGVLTLGLSLLADFAPELAAPVAVLVIVGAYMRHRGVLGKVLPSEKAGR